MSAPPSPRDDGPSDPPGDDMQEQSITSEQDVSADREIKREELRNRAPPDLIEAFDRVLDDPLWLHPDENDQLPLSAFEPFYRKERPGGRDSFLCILFDQEDPGTLCSMRCTPVKNVPIVVSGGKIGTAMKKTTSQKSQDAFSYASTAKNHLETGPGISRVMNGRAAH